MPRPVVHLIAHTHWDREWYLPLGAFRARLVPMVDGLLRQAGVSPVVKPVLDNILNRLDTMAKS